MRQVYTAKIDADMGSQTGYLVESECLGKEESKQASKQAAPESWQKLSNE